MKADLVTLNYSNLLNKPVISAVLFITLLPNLMYSNKPVLLKISSSMLIKIQ